ncbi:MAG: HAMP domain-containing histidine kinase [Pirellulales bacterium]|nr:HAMP domain-containing histidine kinase [Pirellulales bacterium]
MADGSAAALAQCLLAADPDRASGGVETALLSDPPLVLWTVARAGAAIAPRGVREVAQWLARHALEVLRFDEPGDDEADADPAVVRACADRAAADVETALLAEALARRDEPDTAAEALLLGLLGNPAGWLAGKPTTNAASIERLLPAWLAEAAARPASRYVARAAAMLAGQAADGIEEPLAECRRRAQDARRRWSQPMPGAGRALAALAARLRRLADLEQRFQETLDAEKLAAMAEFAAGAGHEINNPLAVIAGRAQLFLQDETDPERRRGLALINAQAKRVWEMIADMRLFARPPKPSFEPTDLAALVDRLVEELSPEMAQQAVSLARGGAAGPLVVEADPVQIVVALRAMCRNSLEAIGRDGRVAIELDETPGGAEIRVVDDGPGFSDEVRRHLFDPYYSARQAGRGLGLGLSKCWRIVVTNHHGRVDAQSPPGGGSSFTVTLPRTQPRAPSPAETPPL